MEKQEFLNRINNCGGTARDYDDMWRNFCGERYDYEEAVKNDVIDYIDCEIDFKDYGSREELEEYLNEHLWDVDSVTGNGSGSYTFNTWRAEENLCHNLDLLGEALSEFGFDTNYLQEKGAEACDVTIRCYLLSRAISEALDHFEETVDGLWEDEEDDDYE